MRKDSGRVPRSHNVYESGHRQPVRRPPARRDLWPAQVPEHLTPTPTTPQHYSLNNREGLFEPIIVKGPTNRPAHPAFAFVSLRCAYSGYPWARLRTCLAVLRVICFVGADTYRLSFCSTHKLWVVLGKAGHSHYNLIASSLF